MEQVGQDIFEDLEDLVQPKTYYQSYNFLSEKVQNNFIAERFEYLIESLNLAIRYQIYLDQLKRLDVLYNLQLF